MKIYLLHGFNVSDGGKGSIDKIIKPLQSVGHEIVELDYGNWNRLRVRLANKPLANIIAKLVEPGSVLIGHSNGACIAQMAAMAGARINQLILINPALDSDSPMPNGIRCDVCYSPDDKVVELSRWIPWSPWGNMGRVGSTSGGINHNLEDITGNEIGHSSAFSEPLFHHHLINAVERAGTALEPS